MRRLRLGSVFGIPIQLDISFLLVLPIFAYVIGSQVALTATFLNDIWNAGIATGELTGGAMPWILGTVAAIGLFAGVVLHELGHSVVALRFGFAIDSITLWILGGIASFSELPENWRQELLIAIAGPTTSVLVGAVCFLGFVVLPESFAIGRFVFGYLSILNVGLAAFNLLPGFPMDGGRVLRALLARTRPYPQATQIAASVGKGFAVLLGLVGILWFNIFLIAIAFFVYIGASSEVRQELVKSAFEGIKVAQIMTPVTDLDVVSPTLTVAELLERMFRQRHVGYPVLQEGEVVGVVTLDDVSPVPEVEREAVHIADVMETDLKTISEGADVTDALLEIQRSQIGRLLVVNDRDEFVGLLTRTDLIRAFTIISQVNT